jgi:hypothetical protein
MTRVTSYYVDCSDELIATMDNSALPLGFNFIERTATYVGQGMQRWLVEDEDAPESLEGALVTPTFTRVLTPEGGQRCEIVERYVRG